MFVARSIGSTSTTLSPGAAEPLRLRTPGGALSLTPLGVARSARAGELVSAGAAVRYRATARDTDTIVIAQPAGGVETFSRLTSPDAPHRFSWRVRTDGVSRLVPTTTGGVNVVRAAPAVRRSVPPSAPPASPSTGSRTGRAVQLGASARAGFPSPGGSAAGVSGRPVPSHVPAPCLDVTARDRRAALRGDARGMVRATSGLFSMAASRKVRSAADLLHTPAVTCTLASTAPATVRPVAVPRDRYAGRRHQPGALLAAQRQNHQVILAAIQPPRSIDANGRPVPTRLTVAGDVVTMHVDHGLDDAYPVMADPLVSGHDVTAPCSDIVQSGIDRNGRPMLTRDCRAWFAVGFNDYRIVNYAAPVPFTFPRGCGAILNYEDQEYELQRIADSGSNVVRVWFFQKYYQDYLENHPRGSGWMPFVQLLRAARAKGLLVVPVLINEWNQCDRKDGTAHNGQHAAYTFYGPQGSSPGYTTAGTFGYRYSAKQWAQMVATHFSPNNSGAIGDLWKSIAYFQIVNEAEADLRADDSQACAPNGAQILRDFGQDMATTIKSAYVGSSAVAAPLVSLGTMGIGQCGVSSAVEDPVGRPSESDFAYIHSASAIDVCEVHDYDAQSKSDITWDWYGIPYNSLAQRLAECGSKPMVIGEAGLEANVQEGAITRGHFRPGPHPDVTQETLTRRAQYLSNKLAAAFSAGVSGYLMWDKIMAASDSDWNHDNDENLGFGAYGFRSGGVKHQDPSLCVMDTIAKRWTIGEAPPAAPSTAECDAQIPVPGPANHYAFVDGTAETWGRNAGGWGNLGTAYSNAHNHGGLDGTGSLRVTVGGAPLDTSVFQTTIGGHTYNPYSEIEVETDAVALLTPGDDVTMWVYNPSTNGCRALIEVKPVLRLNSNWDAYMPPGRTIAANQWTQLAIRVPTHYGPSSQAVSTVHAVGLEVDVPGSGTDCYGQSIFLDDVTW